MKVFKIHFKYDSIFNVDSNYVVDAVSEEIAIKKFWAWRKDNIVPVIIMEVEKYV